jgi:WD40 repeat protein
VKAFDTKNFNLLDTYGKFKETNRAWTCDMDFRENSNSEAKIFVGYEEKSLKVLDFDKKNGKFKFSYEFLAHLDPIKSLTLCAQKKMFVTGCRDGSSRIWSLEKTVD